MIDMTESTLRYSYELINRTFQRQGLFCDYYRYTFRYQDDYYPFQKLVIHTISKLKYNCLSSNSK
jgi:hypothetical protein